jgi:branched-chain amino acid transport system permease protein
MIEWVRQVDQRRAAWARSIGGPWRRMSKPSRLAVGLGAIVLLYVLPLYNWPIIGTPDSDWPSVLFYPIAIYVLCAVGLNVVVGYSGLLDLGYVAFFAVGCYTVALLGGKSGSTWSWPPQWPWLLCVPVGVAVAVIAGLALGTPTLRLRGDYLAIVTLGFGEIIRITINNMQGLGGARGITGLPHPPSVAGLHFGVLDSKPYYWLALTVIIGVIFFMRRLERSRVGRAWTAIREDEDAAELMGVPTFKFKLYAFAIGAAVGGLSGTLFAGYSPSVVPDQFQLLLSILFLAAVVLGGSGNLPGVILGAFLVGYLPERFRGFQEKRIFLFGLALVIMMIFRPQGILPSRQRTSELEHPQDQPDDQGLAGADIEDSFDPTLRGGDV